MTPFPRTPFAKVLKQLKISFFTMLTTIISYAYSFVFYNFEPGSRVEGIRVELDRVVRVVIVVIVVIVVRIF